MSILHSILAKGPGHGASGMVKRILPLAILVAAMAAFFALGLHRYLSLETLRANRDTLQTFVAHNLLVAMLAYMAIYVAAVAMSLPGGVWLTLSGGFLFGWAWGTALTVVAATAGAALLFVIARTAVGDVLRRKAGPFIKRMEQGFQENSFSYLLVLRLVPAFPFWVVNLVPALLGVRLSTFVLATLIGIVPGTFAFASFGAGIGSLLDMGGEVNLRDALTPEILAALIGLAVLAVVPVGVKKLRARRGA